MSTVAPLVLPNRLSIEMTPAIERTMHSLNKVLVVDDDPVILSILVKALEPMGYQVSTSPNAAAAFKHLERSVPDVILTDMLMPGMNGKSFCRRLRKSPETSGIPIIMISTESSLTNRLEGFRAGADDYITKPFEIREVKARLDRLLSRNERALSSNPLSHLPGNPSIELEANRLLAEKASFAFAYVDIDDFKAYNDVYGYQAGDHVLKDLSRLLVAASSSVSRESFVGHVGGDDFVLISSVPHMRAILKIILKTFDREARTYYSSADQRLGGIVTTNRQNHKQFFPLMKLSCAVIHASIRPIHHYAELVEIATELKHHLKTKPHRKHSLAMWNNRMSRKGLNPKQR